MKEKYVLSAPEEVLFYPLGDRVELEGDWALWRLAKELEDQPVAIKDISVKYKDTCIFKGSALDLSLEVFEVCGPPEDMDLTHPFYFGNCRIADSLRKEVTK